MSLIRRVSCPAAAATQVIPPVADRAGKYSWTVINPTGSGGQVELVDDPTKAIGQGFPMAAGAVPYTTIARADQVWALGPASGAPVVVIVLGTDMGE